MINADDPDFAAKRLEELFSSAIFQVASESRLPALILHRVLMKMAHRVTKDVVDELAQMKGAE